MKDSARRYRITKASIVWIVAAVLLIPYEIACIVRGVDGGPLSHVMWWAYGDRGSLRWWLISCTFNGFALWACWHFMLRWPALPHLVGLVLLGLVMGVLGYITTH